MDFLVDTRTQRENSNKIPNFNQCCYCPHLQFSELEDFTRHLRESHCTVEGGSYVCRYGYNAVCNSLPVEGVSDSDYVKHIYKRHVHMDGNVNKTGLGAMSRKLSSSSQHSCYSDCSSPWTVYSASQNLAAVLNDPNRGKQKDFFTKTWGADFTEKTQSDIPNHPYLPQVNHSHFESYLRKISKRHKKHQQLTESSNEPPQEILNLFPKVRLHRALDKRPVDKPDIPDIFLQSDFDMSKPETFYTVFPFAKDGIQADRLGTSRFQQSSKLLQERLTHDLDHVEVLIAEQVAHKSEAFFQAMTSHDSLMEKLGSTLRVVRAMRERMAVVDKSLAWQPLAVLQLARRRRNHMLILQKLKLMSTLLQTQPTIQILLSTSDFVTALDLIFTSQELLGQEMQNVICFRHLGSQLTVMSEVILNILKHELEGYCTRDLNRPLTEDPEVLEPDKLVCIILGMLKHGTHVFVTKYREEALISIQTVVKQIVLESLAEHDSAAEGAYKVEQAEELGLEQLIELLETVCRRLAQLLRRIKAVHDVISDTIETATQDGDPTVAISEAARAELGKQLEDLLGAVCNSAHTEGVKLLVLIAKPKQERHAKARTHGGVPANNTHVPLDKITSKQIHRLFKFIEHFTNECEKLNGKISTPLKAAFQKLSTDFVTKLHDERKLKLLSVMESECWRLATEVSPSFQSFVECVERSGTVAVEVTDVMNGEEPLTCLVVTGEKHVVVQSVLVLVQIVAEYSCLARDLPWSSTIVLHDLAQILELFNSISCQLLLGAAAVQSKKMETITTTNLALCSRSLQLVLWLLPHLSKHFDKLLPWSNTPASAGSVHVKENDREHVESPSDTPPKSAKKVENDKEHTGSQPDTTPKSAASVVKAESDRDHSGSRSETPPKSAASVLAKVKSDMRDHVDQLHLKVVVIVSGAVAAEVASWVAKPPVPSIAFKNISRSLAKLHEAVSPVLPPPQVESLYRTIHKAFKGALREQLRKLKIVNNGGPQHGYVTSELIFYIDTLRKLKVFSEDLNERSMDDIWESR